MKNFIGIVIIVLFSCKKPDENILSINTEIVFVDSFPEEVSLEFKSLIDYPNGTILKLVETDSYYYMLDIEANKGHFIHVYSKKDNDFIEEKIKQGNGPFESFAPYSIDYKSNNILLSDFEMRKIIEIDLMNIETGSTELKLDAYYNEIKYYSDSVLIATSSTSSKEKFFFLNKETGEIIYTKGNFENIPAGIEANHIPDFFQSAFGLNPKLDKVANAYRWLDVLEIVDLNTNQSIYVKTPKNIENKLVRNLAGNISLDRGGDAKECFVDLAYTEHYIYGLFSGNEDKTPGAYLSDIIYIFDWEGNAIKQINLDRKVMSISVSPDDSRVYSFDIDTGEVIYIDL